MPKFVMMPPLDEQRREWARRLADTLPEYEVVAPETDAAARWELAEADAAFGWIPPEALKKAHRLRWLQNPDAGPFAGYFYPDLIDHPVIVCNPRGIYFDHISHHVRNADGRPVRCKGGGVVAVGGGGQLSSSVPEGLVAYGPGHICGVVGLGGMVR